VEAPRPSAPSYVPSSSCHRGNGYMVKRVLEAYFACARLWSVKSMRTTMTSLR
jgi:hypothetical protein